MENKLTGKERSMLAALASRENAIFQIGKDGISPSVIQGLSAALEARELVKISVLKSAEKDAGQLAADLSATLEAEVIRTIGSKIILYRKSSRKNFEHILPKK